MWALRGGAQMYATLWGYLIVLAALVGGEGLGWSSDDPDLREACANAFDYGEPTCLSNSTLYWGTGELQDFSCSHCVCDEGWSGVDCGRCLDVSVCPSKFIDGQVQAATNCSADTLLLTEEEARSDEGKVFSCSCGGGEDGWTAFLCAQQPDTWIHWAVTGGGTEEDPASVALKEYAGIHARTEEEWPNQFKYHYPKIFEGYAETCKVYRDKCFPIEGTDLEHRDCVIFDCEDTEGQCPPPEYPMCDGFPHCKAPNGEEYETHPCTASPIAGNAITIACQEQKVNGSYVCYYQQPGGFAPLSMTCSVGSCLYQGGSPVQPSGSKTKGYSWSLGAQMAILVSFAGLLLISFALFAIVSDPGTAETAAAFLLKADTEVQYNRVGGAEPRRQQQQGEEKLELGDQDLTTPLLGRVRGGGGGGDGGEGNRSAGRASPAAEAVGERPRQLSIGGTSVHTVSLESVDGDGGRDDAGAIGNIHHRRQQPAVLRWSKLSYFVPGQGKRRSMELAVLRGVSGFAGPDPQQQKPPPLQQQQQQQQEQQQPLGGAASTVETIAGDTESSPGVAAAAASPPSPCSPSTMTGILGPSGAGKSSLLDLLAGRKRQGEGRTTGSVSLAFGDSSSSPAGLPGGVEAVRRIGGYVSQEDVLPGTLTCYEHLMFHAQLRMPPGTGFPERARRVLWVMEELGLSRVADSRIGDDLERGLSGGERRRLSIATELVLRPALLFADEPTTGLDAATALRIMTLLRGIASRGTTVLCSLHQPRPRVVHLLDKVILLSSGRVAYFGSPRDAERYFRSVGRPFPAEQPHPADAMLTLCCREDGRELPSLFRRSRPQFSSEAWSATVSAAGGSSAGSGCGVATEYHREEVGGGGGGGAGDPAVSAAGRILNADDGDVVGESTELVEVGLGPGPGQAGATDSGGGVEGAQTGDGGGSDGGGEREALLKRQAQRRRQQQKRPRQRGRPPVMITSAATTVAAGTAGGAEKLPAPFLVQVEALSRRLLLRAVRHPLLLVLHFGGSVAMALCLASVFGGQLGYNLAGAQNRFGALFFLLLYLSLLSLTSLPVWREDRRLFLSESMGGAYGHLPYFTSVALADILLIRVLPPLAFAVVGYPLMGLNSEPDNPACLLWFAGILVLGNVTVALAAMGVGALGLPLDLSNLVGGVMVLLLAAFGRFLLNGTRIPFVWRWLSSVTPLGYAFEALLINEFSDTNGERPYRIEGSHCSPDLPVIEPLGPQILTTFSFSPERSTMHLDVGVLIFLAAGLATTSLLVFFLATRTKPLVVDFLSTPRYAWPAPPGSNMNMPRHGGNNPASIADGDPEGEAQDLSPGRPAGETRAAASGRGGGRTATAETSTTRSVSWNIPVTLGGPPDGSGAKGGGGGGVHRRGIRGGGGGSGRRSGRAGRGGGRAPPLLLTWEGLRYEITVPRRRSAWLGFGFGTDQTVYQTVCGGGIGGGGDGVSVSGLDDDEHGLLILDGVSGLAGPTNRRAAAAAAARGSDSSAGAGPAAASTSASTSAREGIGLPGGDGDEADGWEGTVTAIMGPSGAGKTTLLNALAGRLHAAHGRSYPGGVGGLGFGLTGAVRLNGEAVSAAQVRSVSAYVTQEDVLPETLTCYEHLMFHAHLRLPAGTSLARRHDRVMEVMRQLALLDIRDSRVGGDLSRGISGGEKRRLSIGTELLTRPALLFADEPTTGLDSSTALRVMQLVSEVAALGTTVVCSVHQPRPEVVRLLDKVIVLSRGVVAFSGPPSEAEAYFASIGRPFPQPSLAAEITATNAAGGEKRGDVDGGGGGEGEVAGGVNPTDAILDVIGAAEAGVDRDTVAGVGGGRGVEGGSGLVVMSRELLVRQVRAAEASGPPPTSLFGFDAETTRKSPHIATQLSALLRRSALNVARDPYLAALHLLLTVCVGLVVGSLFRNLGRLNKSTAGVQDRLGVVFLLLLYLSLLCLTSLAPWRKQMALFAHERASGAYGAAAHLTAAASVDALACRVLPPVLLAVAVRPLAGLRKDSLPGLIGGLVAYNLSLAGVLAACGAGARSSQEALAMGCLVVMFSSLLSGFLVANDNLPPAWGVLAWLSPIGRGFEALVANEFSAYGAVFRLSTKIGDTIAYTDPMTGDEVLGCFGFDGDRYWADLGVLAAVGGCGLALAFVFLKRSRG